MEGKKPGDPCSNRNESELGDCQTTGNIGKGKRRDMVFRSREIPGSDNITLVLLQQSLHVIMRPPTGLLRDFIGAGYTSGQSINVKVTFIPKPGRRS